MPPILFSNVVIIWFFSAIAILAGVRILKDQRENKEAFSFGWFWSILGFCYFFFGLRLLSFWLGYPEVDKTIFLIIYLIMPIGVAGAVYHLILKISNKEKIAKIAGAIFLLATIFFIILMLAGGIEGPVLVSDWGSEYEGSPLAMATQKILFGSLMILLIFHFFLFLFRWLIKNATFQPSKFFSTLSILIFFGGSTFDAFASEVQQQWLLFLGRIIYLVAAMIAYFCYQKKI